MDDPQASGERREGEFNGIRSHAEKVHTLPCDRCTGGLLV